MIPRTPLLCAPSDAVNTFGSAILSGDLVRGLQKINPQIRAWEQFPEFHWYPGRSQGITCLWIGEPGGASRKISAFNSGPIPEFTQIGPNGQIMVKGWRKIFDKVIKSGAATRPQIERQFRVNLAIDERRKDGNCSRCIKAGLRRKAVGASGLCKVHESVRLNAERSVDRINEVKYLRRARGLAPNAPVNPDPATPLKPRVFLK